MAGSTSGSTRPRDRKNQIAENATELFAQYGFHSVRMEDIATASGITARALYRHYENKQALLGRVVINYHGRLLAVLKQTEAPDAEDPGSLERVLEGLAAVCIKSRRLSLLWQRESRHLSDVDLSQFRARGQMAVSEFRRVFQDYIPSNDLLTCEIRSWAGLSLLTSAGRIDDPSLSHAQLVRLLANGTRSLLLAPAPWGGPTMPISDKQGFAPVSRRERLIAGAAGTLRRHGYAGVGIDDIGASAGVAGPAIYRYFESKADVLVALINRFHEWIAHENSRALARGGNAETILEALLLGYINVALEATDLMAVATNESLHLPTDAAERAQRIQADEINEWAGWLRETRPDMSEQVAEFNVHAARTVVNNLALTPPFRRHPRLIDEIQSAASAALYANG